MALVVYGMPVQLALMSTLNGAAYGLFPIAWIVFALDHAVPAGGGHRQVRDHQGLGRRPDQRPAAAGDVHRLLVRRVHRRRGRLRRAGGRVRRHARGPGLLPFYAAGICLLANTAPVAFGSIGIPVTTLAGVTGLPVLPLSAMVGRLCAMISVIIPGVSDRRDGGLGSARSKCCRPIMVCGVSFAGVQFYVSNYMGPELTDILSSLTCIGAMVLVLKFWKPKTIIRLEGEKPSDGRAEAALGPAKCFVAWLPYLLLVVFVLVVGRGRRSSGAR